MVAAPRLNRLPAAERGITIGDFLVPIRVGERLSSRTRHIALIVAGALIMALSANLSIPVPGSPIPVTGQTFAVLLVGGALGFRRGVLATLLYLAMGLVLPVYASHGSGIATIASIKDGGLVLGSSGGYLLGFIFASALVGRLAELGCDRRVGGALGAMVLGNIVIYLIGLPWLAAALHKDAAWTIANGLTPFLLGDLLKLALAAGLFPVAWWVVGRRPGER
ncbi:MAG TPA: biotin transporter BioY [Candidatus Acidoferrum sp.]|nr:biotin transporter BioY [Candidatus Acidoferrum sp.]